MPPADTATGAMLSPREWRFVRAGALVSLIALVTAFGVLPFARRWNAREAQLGAERERLARLESLVLHKASIDSAASVREAMLAMQPRRVIRARSSALAAASLQSLLQEMADASNVTMSRLDVAAEGAGSTQAADATTANANGDAAPELPATLSATGDIFGLASFLNRIRSGPRVLVVDRITVQVNSALRGAPDVLQMALSVRAPVIVE